jgi:hypothetical protein
MELKKLEQQRERDRAAGILVDEHIPPLDEWRPNAGLGIGMSSNVQEKGQPAASRPKEGLSASRSSSPTKERVDKALPPPPSSFDPDRSSQAMSRPKGITSDVAPSSIFSHQDQRPSLRPRANTLSAQDILSTESALERLALGPSQTSLHEREGGSGGAKEDHLVRLRPFELADRKRIRPRVSRLPSPTLLDTELLPAPSRCADSSSASLPSRRSLCIIFHLCRRRESSPRRRAHATSSSPFIPPHSSPSTERHSLASSINLTDAIRLLEQRERGTEGTRGRHQRSEEGETSRGWRGACQEGEEGSRKSKKEFEYGRFVASRGQQATLSPSSCRILLGTDTFCRSSHPLLHQLEDSATKTRTAYTPDTSALGKKLADPTFTQDMSEALDKIVDHKDVRAIPSSPHDIFPLRSLTRSC